MSTLIDHESMRIAGHPGGRWGAAWRQVVTDCGPFPGALVAIAMEHDARLIAAAPDMLSALREAEAEISDFLAADGGDETDSPALVAIRAVLARVSP